MGVNPTRNVEVSEEALISCLHLKRKMPGGLLFLSAVCDVTCHGESGCSQCCTQNFYLLNKNIAIATLE